MEKQEHGTPRFFAALEPTLSSSAGTGVVSALSHGSGPTFDTSGLTDQRGPMAPDGSMMSSIAGWLMGGRSFEITGAVILLSFAMLLCAAGVLAHAWDVSRRTFWLGKQPYEMVGITEVQPGLYMPVYREKKQ